MKYNLIKDPWIRCTMKDGSTSTFGIEEILKKSSSIHEIWSSNPLFQACAIRLLSAIIIRSCDVRSSNKWSELMKLGEFPQEVFEYLNEWYDKFHLCGTDSPFMQDPTIEREKGPVPISFLTFDQSSGDKDGFIDLSTDNDFRIMSHATAAENLLIYHCFSNYGFHHAVKSGKAANLANNYVVCLRGDNLFESLMMNCLIAIGYDYTTSPEKDIPCWERTDIVKQQERTPDGPVDQMTWQPRKIRMFECEGGFSHVIVHEGWETVAIDPMCAKRTTASGIYSFGMRDRTSPDPGSLIWKNGISLCAKIEGDSMSIDPPLNISAMYSMVESGKIDENKVFMIDICGIMYDQASPAFSIRDMLPLPSSKDKADLYKKSIDGAMKTAIWMYQAMDFTPISIKGKNGKVKKQPKPLFTLDAISFWSSVENLFRKSIPSFLNGEKMMGDKWAEEVFIVNGIDIFDEYIKTKFGMSNNIKKLIEMRDTIIFKLSDQMEKDKEKDSVSRDVRERVIKRMKQGQLKDIPSERATKFVNHLYVACKDRGTRAHLRNGMKNLENGIFDEVVMGVVGPHLEDASEVKNLLTIASLYASHRLNSKNGNFGTHMKHLGHFGNVKHTDTILTRILSAENDDLVRLLRNVITRMSTNNIHINWALLMDHLLKWDDDVKMSWAIAYFTRQQNRKGEPNESDEQ